MAKGKNMRKIISFIFIIIIAIVVHSFAQEKQIKVIVKDSDGKPLEKVKNYYPIPHTETNSDGELIFKSHNKILFLYKESYKPNLIKIDYENPIKITLENDFNPKRLFLRECSKNEEKKGWFDVLIKLPRGYKRNKSSDIDYGSFSIYKKKDKDKDLLKGISGALAGGVTPDDELILNTKAIFIRTIISNNYNFAIGFDFSGITTDGKYWRKINFDDEHHIYYSVKSEQTKNEFDKMIDNSCLNISRYKRK